MKYGKQTDMGCVRTNNEDAVTIECIAPEIDLVMVADGMGGHLGGEIASKMVLEIVGDHLKQGDVSPTAIREAVQEANKRIFEMSETEETCSGMGTTLVLAVVCSTNVLIANVGDSRAYYYQAETKALQQVTRDHSLAEELFQTGKLTKETVKTFPLRNVITRAVGTEPSVNVDFFEIDWLTDDMILLCSDGLTEEICDEILLKKLALDKPIQVLCNDLVKMARHAGGRDNITILLARNTKDGERP